MKAISVVLILFAMAQTAGASILTLGGDEYSGTPAPKQRFDSVVYEFKQFDANAVDLTISYQTATNPTAAKLDQAFGNLDDAKSWTGLAVTMIDNPNGISFSGWDYTENGLSADGSSGFDWSLTFSKATNVAFNIGEQATFRFSNGQGISIQDFLDPHVSTEDGHQAAYHANALNAELDSGWYANQPMPVSEPKPMIVWWIISATACIGIVVHRRRQSPKSA